MRRYGETLTMMMNRAAPPVKCPRRGGVRGPVRGGVVGGQPATGEVTMSSTSHSPPTFCIVTVTWSL